MFKNTDEYKILTNKYKEGQEKISKIIIKAEKEVGIWEKVIEDFNNRFVSFPFKLNLENKSDIILKEEEIPNVKFSPKKDKEDIKGHEKTQEEVKKFMSAGEKRALYLLTILFNIEIQKRESEGKILIFDDIADSFDYQNKYAIIEYLVEISNKFNVIILTQNFDFLRTLKYRMPSANTYIAHKNSEKINFEKFKEKKGLLTKSPFKKWRDNINNDKYDFLASLPLIRNLLELIGLEKKYSVTDLLHFKKSTTEKRMKDIKEIYKKVNISLEYANNEKIYDMLKKYSKKIIDKKEPFELRDKVILSIAIRLMAEEIMIEEIGEFFDEIKSNQTRELIEKYKKKFEEKKRI